jgi:hypothetical protein
MARRFEYRVCNVQQSRVTFVGGEWTGTVPPSDEDSAAALESCPHVWAYLDGAGYDGWELVGAVGHQTEHGSYELLYLRRER